MWRLKYHKLSVWDVAYAVGMAVACLVTYWIMALLLPEVAGWPSTPVGTLWAVISAAFVYRDTRNRSLSAGVLRLVATFASLLLCLAYLLIFPATAFGMAVLIMLGTVTMTALGRSDEIGLTAITTAVVMIVAASDPHSAWIATAAALCRYRGWHFGRGGLQLGNVIGIRQHQR